MFTICIICLQDDVLPDGHYEDVRKWNSFPVHTVSFIYSIHGKHLNFMFGFS